MMPTTFRNVRLNCTLKTVRKSLSAKLGSIRKYHVAVIGSGPAAFYTTKYLLDKEKDMSIDMIERLSIPFGLVRYGVAPDHPEVKSVSSQFEELVAANGARFRYFGNVHISDTSKVTLDVLRKHYSAVVLAYGAQAEATLHIPNRNLKGIFSARQFVNWYNGHPEYAHLGREVQIEKVKDVVVVGHGNVALDCARILAKSHAELHDTDISPIALDALKHSGVERITIVGRRGHIQAQFTIKEFRELTKLDTATLSIRMQEIEAGLTEASKVELKENRAKTRIVELMNKVATESASNVADTSKPKSMEIRFLVSPKAYVGDDNGRVSHLTVERNSLSGDAHKQTAKGTGEIENLPCQLVLESIGYKSEPISKSLPFNTTSHTVLSSKGRVATDSFNIIKGLYVAGWAKRGPTGIIGTNITDAKETVSSVLEDIKTGIVDTQRSDDPVASIPALQEESVVSWQDYLHLKETEASSGMNLSPPRPQVKLATLEEIEQAVKLTRRKE